MRKEQILEFCVEPQSLSDILQHLGLKDRENLMEVYINPMIGAGVLEMTEPDNPTSRNQMYVTVKVEQEFQKKFIIGYCGLDASNLIQITLPA